MTSDPAVRPSVRAWTVGDVVFETYERTAGPKSPRPKHAHASYQICLHDCDGGYHYRGARVRVGAGALAVVQSGEVHAPLEMRDDAPSRSYRLLYIEPATFRDVAAQAGGRETAAVPAFRDMLAVGRTLAAAFLHAHRMCEQRTAPRLRQDEALLAVLTGLVHMSADPPAAPVRYKARAAVTRAREYVHANLARNVSLAELAEAAAMTPFHFCRTFRRQIGLPPHAYQLQARIDRARQLLSRNVAVKRDAIDCGFVDQAHLTRQFVRVVGVPPAMYRRSAQDRTKLGRANDE